MNGGGLRATLAIATTSATAAIVSTVVVLADPGASARGLLLVGGTLAAVVGVLLTWILARAIVHPLRGITEVAEALARGELGVRTRSQRRDEIGELGRAIDRMADDLAARIALLRTQEERLRKVLDSMVEAVFVTDRQGTIVLSNRALATLARSATEGRTVMEVLRSPELHEAVQHAAKGGARQVEFDVHVGRESRSLSAQLARVEERGVVGVIHDITDLKLTDRIRRDFVANASHELRTPLTAIRGFAETLRDGAIEQPESARRFLDVILRHTLRLQRLVEDLGALSRAESPDQTYELEPTDAVAIATDVVRGLQSQALEKKISLTLEVAGTFPPLLANERALDPILVNLVDNAIKYTPAGGRIVVRMQIDDGTPVIAVCDTGPGIPVEHRERIFERFYRVDSGRSREVGGTGLGLSIVKHLALRIGADVTVGDAPEGGAMLRVVFPAEACVHESGTLTSQG